jgi:hypothetical protein
LFFAARLQGTMTNQEQDQYQANDAEALVSEIFSGGITVADAIERLRMRLLDLSARNRLLNYRHPKGRCIQVADEPNLNLVFNRLYVYGTGVLFKPVPEPPSATYRGKPPEAKLYAADIGISTSFEFPQNNEGAQGHRLHGIQTLLYPAELERQLRKIAGEAKTAVEETGTNMLFLIFGFLEFYDSDDSERSDARPSPGAAGRFEPRANRQGDAHISVQRLVHTARTWPKTIPCAKNFAATSCSAFLEFGDEDSPETYFSRVLSRR